MRVQWKLFTSVGFLLAGTFASVLFFITRSPSHGPPLKQVKVLTKDDLLQSRPTVRPDLISPESLTEGARVLVFWDRLDSWYPATVRGLNSQSQWATFEYDDGFKETIKFSQLQLLRNKATQSHSTIARQRITTDQRVSSATSTIESTHQLQTSLYVTTTQTTSTSSFTTTQDATVTTTVPTEVTTVPDRMQGGRTPAEQPRKPGTNTAVDAEYYDPLYGKAEEGIAADAESVYGAVDPGFDVTGGPATSDADGGANPSKEQAALDNAYAEAYGEGWDILDIEA
eukprot:m.33581 g.33581  ORF g.33581 m.33581 type:complete len:284 (+) comp7224_c0_seq1:266-1117(+)